MNLDQAKTRSAPFIATVTQRDQWLKSRVWDAQRFGVTPTTATRRIRNTAPKVLLATMPKSGTHLLERAVCLRSPFYRRLLPTIHRKNAERYGSVEAILAGTDAGQVLVSHLPHEVSTGRLALAHNVSVVASVRDPRAVLVSSIMHIRKRPEHPMHQAMVAATSFEDCIALRLEAADEFEIPSISKQLASYASWADAGALVLRFEDLVGLRGGGSKENQRRALADLYEHLSCPTADDELDKLASALFSDASPTFRSGQIDGWREHISGDVLNVTNDLFATEFEALGRPDLLQDLGYNH